MTNGPAVPVPSTVNTVDELFARFGHATFDGGLYRIHDLSTTKHASKLVADAFPEMSFVPLCFGFDWLGRQFAIDERESAKPDAEIVLFVPGTGDALDIPLPFNRFHDEALIEFAEDALAVSYYADWRATGQPDLLFDQCAGFNVPLFLGGEDEVTNLEVTDIDVYWSLMGQLRVATQHLQPGTPVKHVSIRDDN